MTQRDRKDGPVNASLFCNRAPRTLTLSVRDEVLLHWAVSRQTPGAPVDTPGAEEKGLPATPRRPPAAGSAPLLRPPAQWAAPPHMVKGGEEKPRRRTARKAAREDPAPASRGRAELLRGCLRLHLSDHYALTEGSGVRARQTK